MVSAGKPPVAIRITRPHETLEALLEHELDTISRSGVVLVGAQQRPEGVVIRFELTLASGAPVLRGEGRVTSYKAAVVGNEPGLAVRFTRLDSKSKALVDKVTALREARRASPSAAPPPSAAEPAPPPEPAPSPRVREVPTAVASSDVLPVPEQDSEPSLSSPRRAAAAPLARTDPSREAVLARLRDRAGRLTPDQVGDILSAGAARRRA